MSNHFRLDELKQKVKQLADLDKNFQIHGSEVHHYQFYPCLSFSSLQDFEEQYQINLPEDYRYFLLNIGNGGAGPGYGLFHLQTQAQLDEQNKVLRQQYENQMSSEKLAEKYNYFSQPFTPECCPLYQRSKDWEEYIKTQETELKNREYFSQKFMEGTIAIADYGCGMTAHLVITGNYRDTIWIDDRINDGGIYPCDLITCSFLHGEDEESERQEETEETNQRLRFLDWYNHWINNSLMILP